VLIFFVLPLEIPNGNPNSPNTYRPPPRTKEVVVSGQVVKLKYWYVNFLVRKFPYYVNFKSQVIYVLPLF